MKWILKSEKCFIYSVQVVILQDLHIIWFLCGDMVLDVELTYSLIM